MDLAPATVAQIWHNTRQQTPLIQCITNFVSMDVMANVLLAAGASPAMVHAVEEVEEFIHKASALVVNVGTLSKDWVTAMHLAAQAASDLQKPWVLDPVGAGGTEYRTKQIKSLLAFKPTLVRGNASEIMALAGASATGRGVDSTADSQDALEMGRQLARTYETVVAITGAVDLVTDGARTIEVRNGIPLMAKITAAGCSVTALAAAFIAANRGDVVIAAASALSIFGLAAQHADDSARGPASLRVGLIDALHSMTSEDVISGVDIMYQPKLTPL